MFKECSEKHFAIEPHKETITILSRYAEWSQYVSKYNYTSKEKATVLLQRINP